METYPTKTTEREPGLEKEIEEDSSDHLQQWIQIANGQRLGIPETGREERKT